MERSAMSGYSDDVKDIELRQFKDRWAPTSEGRVPEWDEETRRWWMARARCAEAQVAAYKQTLRAFGDLFEGVRVR